MTNIIYGALPSHEDTGLVIWNNNLEVFYVTVKAAGGREIPSRNKGLSGVFEPISGVEEE
jgi:hypothetical protein